MSNHSIPAGQPNNQLRTIRLYGDMGRLFGRVHHVALDTNTPAEAVQYLQSQFPKITAYLMGAKDRGVGFAVFAGKRNLAEDELEHPTGADDIRIAPILMGSKNGGVFNIILGAVLIAVGAYINIGSGGVGTPIGNALIGAGVGMALGGVVQLLTPTPKGLASKDKSANTPSYAFNGPLNTEAQGHPVPLLYGGPLKVGSAVISAGIDVRENSAAFQPPKTGEHHMGYGGDMNVGRDESV